jgi:hypothetical protein
MCSFPLQHEHLFDYVSLCPLLCCCCRVSPKEAYYGAVSVKESRMSADPEEPVVPGRLTGGHVIKNMIYKHKGNNEMEIITGWSDQGCREYNQEIVPPARVEGLHKEHPCVALNAQLVECSVKCPSEMRLAGRTATCNEERKVLMQCLVRHKTWVAPAEPARPWYRWVF